MTVSITHAFVSGKAAGTDSTRVYGTHWDADHTVPVATTAEAQAATSDTVLMTPAKTLDLVNANITTSGAALTKTDDTNVTLTLGGTPTTALLRAASLTLGWTGTLSPARGGTGVANNAASTITISGAFATTLTVTGTTGVTLPTSGTLATLAGTEELDNKTLDSSVGKGTWTASGTWTLPAVTLGGTVSLPSGHIFNWNGSDVTLTHSANALTFAGASSGYSFDAAVTGASFIPSGSTVPTNGMYLPSANAVGFAANSTAVMTVNATGIGIGGYNSDSILSFNLGLPSGAGTTAYGFRFLSTIPSAVTTTALMFQSAPSTAAASFTVTTLTHFQAQQNTIGSGSAITNQRGFSVSSNLTSATNNYGFYSDIASSSGRWNFYANGTAPNYFAGEIRIAGDIGGQASSNTITGVSDVTANSTGVGTIKFKGATSRDSTGFVKIYVGTTAYYVPVFSAITG